MKLLFIGISDNEQVRGVEQYCINILKALSKNSDLEIDLLAGDWQGYYNELSILGINIIYAKCGRSKIARHLYLITKIRNFSKQYDIVHYCNTLPVLVKNLVPSVITIHDIAEFRIASKYGFLQRVYRKATTFFTVKVADKILTVSHFSKSELVSVLKVPSNKINVVYNGIGHIKAYPLDITTVTPSKYILYFGVMEQTKGIRELIEAFKEIKDKIPKYKLILIGKEGNEMPFINDNIDDDIKYLGYKTNSEIATFLANASSVVFASQYEGFGFPILESFYYNDNIITANTNSLGEIGADFAICVDPHSNKEIAKAILYSLNNPKTFSTEEKKFILDKYDWDEAAKKTFSEYNKAVESVKEEH